VTLQSKQRLDALFLLSFISLAGFAIGVLLFAAMIFGASVAHAATDADCQAIIPKAGTPTTAAMREASHVYRIGDHTDRQLTDQKARTGLDWIRCQTGELPGCRLPWVPEPSTWRIMVP
jgi:hypothetical protein